MLHDSFATQLQFKANSSSKCGKPLLICFSHLRWDFVFQRPQHLMTRFGETHDIVIWEEPVRQDDASAAQLSLSPRDNGITIATPTLPSELTSDGEKRELKALVDGLIDERGHPDVCWYYTPMMLPISEQLHARCIVYDCMDELANFKGAPPQLLQLEAQLLERADLVFTGGYSLYEAKRARHSNVHPFPSSVDRAHFERARAEVQDAADQQDFAHPRLGFYGVIDERLDIDLIAALADARPDYTIVMVGPVVKIDAATLPQRPNIAWLGQASYAELPAYLAGWDVAIMPFAINEATRFISPTKTPEYLAGGVPVVSTPITDVIRHYGSLQGVKIGATPMDFIAACDAALSLSGTDWLAESDKALRALSWDNVQAEMNRLVDTVGKKRGAKSAPKKHYDYLVVGAGFAGSVMAERLASQSGKRVLVIDRRPHIAGNAFDHFDDAGILVHQYGPHIFHTNSAEVFDYLSQFTDWRPYEHRVLASVDDMLVPMPINRTTLNMLFDLDLKTDEEAETFLASRAEPVFNIRTSADMVISKVGRELYEKFFEGYTRKQWGMDPSELDKSVTARVPTRTDTDDRYFTDKFQAMPTKGYTQMFERMLDHPFIDVRLATDFADLTDVTYDRLVYTGPIDEFFGHRFGKLPYRSLKFVHETLDIEKFQSVGVVNYPSQDIAFTRITEYKHLTGQTASKTSITYEIPSADGDPYYPIPRPENQALFKRYEALSLAEDDVIFVGRLATYRYYNMDQVVGQALATYRKLAQQDLVERIGNTQRLDTAVA